MQGGQVVGKKGYGRIIDEKSRLFPLQQHNNQQIATTFKTVSGGQSFVIKIVILAGAFGANSQYKVDECMKAFYDFVKNSDKFGWLIGQYKPGPNSMITPEVQ